jgi:hypothetical protein
MFTLSPHNRRTLLFKNTMDTKCVASPGKQATRRVVHLLLDVIKVASVKYNENWFGSY